VTHADTVAVLRTYLMEEVLDGPAMSLAADTPLLEWGILTSLSTMRLVSFIAKRFEVDVPAYEVTGQNFRDLDSIARLVESLGQAAVRSAAEEDSR
jgi:acyl carrier protein